MESKTSNTQPLSGDGTAQPKERRYVFIDVVSEKELLADLQEQVLLERADLEGDPTEQNEDQFPVTQTEAIPNGVPVQRRRVSPLFFILIALFVLVMISGSITYVFFLQTATVTIIPDTRQIATTGEIAIVTAGIADPTHNQIKGRILPPITMSQSQTQETTGTTHQEARPGRGTVTFYNAAVYPQPIEANTILTGADGIQVATDYSVTVPAEVLPTFGSVSVTAHSIQTGTAGNIKAGDIYGACCFVNIQAANSAFSGGEAAETSQSVAPADIDTTAASLKTSLIQSVTAALQAQVQSTENLVTPLSCQQTITPDHKEGEKATQVHVTESLACTGVTYDTAALQHLIQTMQAQKASQEQMQHYQLAGEVHAAIQTTPGSEPGTYQLSVHSTGTWVYTFSQSQEHHLAAQIAGMSASQATHILSRTPGVRQVSLSNSLPVLPIDPKHIRFLFLVQ